MSFKSWLGALEVVWGSWLRFGILIMSFKSWYGTLEDARGSWLGFCTLMLIKIWSLVFDTPMFRILALYLDSEGAKHIHVLHVLILGFGGCWRFLTGVWHLDLDLDLVTGLWYTHDLTFSSLSSFWRCKEHPCPLSPDFGLWRTLEFLTGVWNLHLDFEGAKKIHVL